MQEIGNNRIIKHPRITLRITENALAFAVIDNTVDSQVVFEPYIVKSGISIAANLREAFKTSDLLSHSTPRAQVLLDTPVLLIPLEYVCTALSPHFQWIRRRYNPEQRPCKPQCRGRFPYK